MICLSKIKMFCVFSLALSIHLSPLRLRVWFAGFEDLINGNCSLEQSNYCLEQSSHLNNIFSETWELPILHVFVCFHVHFWYQSLHICLFRNNEITWRWISLVHASPATEHSSPENTKIAFNEIAFSTNLRGIGGEKCSRDVLCILRSLCCLGLPPWRMFKIQLNNSGLYMLHKHQTFPKSIKTNIHPWQIVDLFASFSEVFELNLYYGDVFFQ